MNLLMGVEGSQSIGGVLDDTINFSKNAIFTQSFDIPTSLQSEEKLSIRFESKKSVLSVFLTFTNVTGAS